jgi:dTDP-3-amino-3,4,6-trideoxy-alpha-D-glucose transaminase
MTTLLTDSASSVPFFDGAPMMDGLKEDMLADISALIDTGRFINGPDVGEFEALFAAYCQTAACVGAASGLDALRLALIASGLEQGDEVIVPAQTFIATFEAVTQAGGVPVVVDSQESDYNMDPEAADAAVTSRTRFVMPVHLYGQMADMRALGLVAMRHGIHVLEDACQAHGAERDGLRSGAESLAGAFSFYPAKNLGAAGDAGALVTDDVELADRVRALREHGQTEKYKHVMAGFTARMDTLQAIVLKHKLHHLDSWNDSRRTAARFLSEALEGVGDLRLPPVPEGSNPVWHLYVIRTADPEGLQAYLGERGVATGRHYPEPPHLSVAYADLGHQPGSFPVAEAISREGLSLPMFPGMTEQQLTSVVDSISSFFTRG